MKNRRKFGNLATVIISTTWMLACFSFAGEWEIRRLRTSDAAKAGGFPDWKVAISAAQKKAAVDVDISEESGRARGNIFLGKRLRINADTPPGLTFSYTTFCALNHRSGNVAMALFTPEGWDRLGRDAKTTLCRGAKELKPVWQYPLHGMTKPDVASPQDIGLDPTQKMQGITRTYAGREMILAVTWSGVHTSVERASFRNLHIVLGTAENTMDTLLNRLNLDDQSLASVKEKVLSGDKPGAVDALVAHFRKRWPEVPETTKIVRGSMQECDKALENRFRSIGSNTFFKLGEEFEWSRNAIDDKEWLLHFQWHHWLKALVEAGELQQDPRYTKKAIELLRDWIPKNYPGASWSWRTLEVSIRAMVWPQVYRYLLHSPDFTREDHIAFLNTLAEHLDYLLPEERFHSGHNFGASESKALLTAGMTFPEFTNAKTWRDTAWHRFEGEITSQVLSDGAQKELTTGYHNGVLNTFLAAAELVEGTEMKPSALYWERLEKMHDYTFFLTKPDGTQPDLGDSWKGRQGKILLRGSEIFNRPDLAFVGSNGKEGERPQMLDAQLPETGYFVMRTAWTDDPGGLYLCFDAARHWGGWHQHYDALGIIIYGYGRTLTPDAGPFAYGSPLRDRFKSTAFHSTVTIDEKDQDTSPCRVHSVRSVNGFSFADAEHAGYKDVLHRRQILFARPTEDCNGYFLVIDRITGKGKHTLDAHFHLPAGDTKIVGTEVTTCFPEDGNLLLRGLGDGELSRETSWIMTGYGKKEDRPDIRFRQQGNLPAVFVTLLVPYEGKTIPEYQAELVGTATADGVVAVKVQRGDVQDILFAAPNDQHLTISELEMQGQAGLLRRNVKTNSLLQTVLTTP